MEFTEHLTSEDYDLYVYSREIVRSLSGFDIHHHTGYIITGKNTSYSGYQHSRFVALVGKKIQAVAHWDPRHSDWGVLGGLLERFDDHEPVEEAKALVVGTHPRSLRSQLEQLSAWGVEAVGAYFEIEDPSREEVPRYKELLTVPSRGQIILALTTPIDHRKEGRLYRRFRLLHP